MAAQSSSEGPIKIFVGNDRSQSFAVPVLEYSIKQHTNSNVEVIPLDNKMANIKMPDDIRHGPRTGFSLSRFAIPKLMNYKGRAIWLDADMQVFSDISELWNWDFQGHHILIVGNAGKSQFKKKHFKGFMRSPRIRQCSVMVIDCEKCHWDTDHIVAGLGRDYTYEQLMYELCILSDDEICEDLPFRWNSLEHFDDKTSLIHYTDMYTQPWVEPDNPLGYIWFNEVRRMLADGSLTLTDLKEELDAGYLRPSIYDEVQLPLQDNRLPQDLVDKYRQIDRNRGFIKHREANEVGRKRVENVAKMESEMSLLQLITALPSAESRHPIQRAKYLYYLHTH